MVMTEEIMYCEALPLLSHNHVLLLCCFVWDSVRFYKHILGFVLIKRPSSFDFNGGMCADVELVKRRLQVMGMRYVTAVVEEGGMKVDQVFFHGPDTATRSPRTYYLIRNRMLYLLTNFY